MKRFPWTLVTLDYEGSGTLLVRLYKDIPKILGNGLDLLIVQFRQAAKTNILKFITVVQ